MRIRSVEHFSYNDYPGEIVSVIFTQGCNFNCHYCHNKELIPNEYDVDFLEENDVIDEIKKRKNFITAVVLSGGEPTLQPDISSFLWKIKASGFLTGIETNGSKPDAIEWLLRHKLVDFIAMDIKGIFEKYLRITGNYGNIENIERSINLIKNSGIKHEFRTTLCAEITEEDISAIKEYISPSTSFVIQKVGNVS